MKGAKELARMLTGAADRYAEVCGLSLSQDTARTIAAHLDRLAAIDSAVPGEVGEIARRFELYGMCDADAKVLLVIVQHQAGEMAEYRRHAEADTATLNDARIAARAEVERLKDLVDEFKAASMLDVNGDPDGVTPRLLEGHVTALQTEVERLKAERAALAQENARLINEIGELDATAREQRQRAEVLAELIQDSRSGGQARANWKRLTPGRQQKAEKLLKAVT